MEERVLILVKTYPSLSKKYGELVCTAGIRENGDWVRIYPVPFRTLEEYRRYKKFQWISLNLQRNTKDWRKETFRPVSLDSMRLGEKVLSSQKEKRLELLSRAKIYTRIDELVRDSKQPDETAVSLAIFKPAKIVDVFWRKSEKEWDPDVIANITERINQPTLFDAPGETRKIFRVVKKVPYGFYYKIQDDVGRTSRMKIIDWETGALYWKCLKNENEQSAVEKVVRKYQSFAEECDVYLFLGTTHKFHRRAPQPFTIIGVYAPKKDPQQRLF